MHRRFVYRARGQQEGRGEAEVSSLASPVVASLAQPDTKAFERDESFRTARKAKCECVGSCT